MLSGESAKVARSMEGASGASGASGAPGASGMSTRLAGSGTKLSAGRSRSLAGNWNERASRGSGHPPAYMRLNFESTPHLCSQVPWASQAIQSRSRSKSKSKSGNRCKPEEGYAPRGKTGTARQECRRCLGGVPDQRGLAVRVRVGGQHRPLRSQFRPLSHGYRFHACRFPSQHRSLFGSNLRPLQCERHRCRRYQVLPSYSHSYPRSPYFHCPVR
jgi:hypothetical protein